MHCHSKMTKRRAWSKSSIIKEIKIMIDDLGLEVMPTRKEVESYFGDTRLGNAITKRWGWYDLAEKLGLQVKYSETTLGKGYEKKIADKLINDGFEVIEMSQNFPYDLLVNKVKVDVKVSNLGHFKNGSFYSFRTGKEYATCDIYIMVTIDDDGNESVYVIPSTHIINRKQISVGGRSSIYDIYIDAYHYLYDYIEFINKL